MKFAQFQAGQELQAGPYAVSERCIAMRMAALEFLKRSESDASPSLAYTKWPHLVRPGNGLRLQAQVLDLEATSLFKP